MVKVWIIDNDDFKPVDVKILSPAQVYLFPDPERKKILIWAGSQCPKLKLYKAGTLATKFKSMGKYYGYEIEKVDESFDPAKFLSESTAAPAESPKFPRATAPPRDVKGSMGSAPAMTFDEEPSAPAPIASSDPINDVIKELAGIKDLLGKIWQKVKDI